MASVNTVDFGFCDERSLFAVIADFAARHDGRHTVVEWETATEIGTVGFFLYRQMGLYVGQD